MMNRRRALMGAIVGGGLPGNLTKCSGGTFSVDSDTTSVTIPTNLGEAAKFIVIYSVAPISFYSENNNKISIVSIVRQSPTLSPAIFQKKGSNNTIAGRVGTPVTYSNDYSTATISLGSGNLFAAQNYNGSEYKNVTYEWYAFA